MPFFNSIFFIYILLKGCGILTKNETRIIKPSDGEIRGGGGYKQPSQPPTNIKGVPPKK